MRLVKAVLAYDGTAFRGWQSQTNAPSVQASVHKALQQIHGRAVKTVAASRTDGGVHAEGQVIHFETDSYLTDAKLRIAMNYNLPPSVAIRSLRTVKPPFHARYGAKGKLYRYVIYTARTKPVFERPHVWWLESRLDVAAMRRAARTFVGRHDFTSFSVPSPEDKSKVRSIRSIRLRKTRDRI
jgi:tRNA pseudouridine38-40 synthase